MSPALLLVRVGSTRGQSTSFRDHPASSTVLLNFPTTLSCSTNLPYPQTIVWQFNGAGVNRERSTFDSNSGRSLLSFTSIAYSDAGNYTCIALGSSNNVVATSQPAVLSVQGKANIDKHLFDNSSFTLVNNT